MNDQDVIYSLFENQEISITQIAGKGEVNRVYLVATKNNKIIVRLNDKDELPRFTKEAWCMEQATILGIQNPRLLRVGSTNETAYMVLEHVVGNNGKDIVTDKEMVWRTIGKYAKKINSIITDGFSENMTSPGVFSDTWERYLTYNINSLDSKDALLRMGVINEGQSKKLKEKFWALQNKNFTFGLIHGDLSLANVIVEGEIVTLIDWGVAESTIVPHMEIVDLLQNQMTDTDRLFHEFLSGYGMKQSVYESIKPEIEVLTLLQATDKLRWAIDRKPEKVAIMSQKLQKIIDMENFL